MARIPRKLLFDPAEVGVYHCINRCVRRARLIGRDPRRIAIADPAAGCAVGRDAAERRRDKSASS